MRRASTLRLRGLVTSFFSVKRGSNTDGESAGLPDSRRVARSGTRSRFVMPVVLVVDDVEDNRELVSLVLGRRGYSVELAIDGIDAIERARALRPTLILMDLAMPNMDGFDATRSIRAIPELASAYIIAFSAFTDVASKERALAAGCNEILGKPCAPDALLARVEAALPMNRAEDVG